MGIAGRSTPEALKGRSLLERGFAVLDRQIQQTEAITPHGCEVAYLFLLAILLGVGWLGLVLAELGLFSLLTLGALTFIATIIVILVRPKAAEILPISWSWDVVGVLPALALAVLLFTPPFEYVLGGADPGVYVSTGVNIARTGSILIADSDLTSLSASARAALFSSGLRLDGFYIIDPRQDRVEPHGFHLYPTVLAIAYAIGGIWAILWMTPIIALIALTGFYLLVRRLFGPIVAAVAALLLAANPAVIWFARYPAAENLVELWLLGGLLAFVLMLDTRSRLSGVLAGGALGAVHLTKIEVAALPAALFMFFVYQLIVRRWRVEYGYFVAAYLLLTVHAILHAHFVASVYSYSLVNQLVLSQLPSDSRIGLAVLVVAVVAGLYLGRAQIRRGLISQTWTTLAPLGAGLVILLLAGYAYYVRPRFGGVDAPTPGMASGDVYAWANRASFVILGWYVSPLALLLAPLGFVIAIRRVGTTRAAVLLWLVFLEMILQLDDGRIRPLHFWAARRDLPVIFPSFAIFSAYLLWRMQLAVRGRGLEMIIPSVVGLVVLLSCLGGWLPFLSHVEFRGAIEQIGQVAAAMPPGSAVLLDDSHAGHMLATPIEYVWNRPAFVLGPRAEEDNQTGKIIADWLAQGRKVYWVRAQIERLPQDRGIDEISTRSAPMVGRWGYDAVPVASPIIDLPFALATIARRPDTIVRLHYELRIYQIVPSGEQPGSTRR